MVIADDDKDDKPVTLLVRQLTDRIRRRGSDQLVNLPIVDGIDIGDVYPVCDVLPQDPTDEQFDDLAVRASSFMEDVHRLHVEQRAARGDSIAAACVPLSIPIFHRGRLREAKAADAAPQQMASIKERETLCIFHLRVPLWRGYTWAGQAAAIDVVARRHGLRCVDQGRIPE